MTKPKTKNKMLKRIGIVAFVLINAAVIFFTARDEFTKDNPPPMEPFTMANIIFLLCGIRLAGQYVGPQPLFHVISIDCHSLSLQ